MSLAALTRASGVSRLGRASLQLNAAARGALVGLHAMQSLSRSKSGLIELV